MVLSRDRPRWGCSPTCPTRPIPQRVPQQTPTNRVLVGTKSPNAFGTSSAFQSQPSLRCGLTADLRCRKEGPRLNLGDVARFEG